MQAEFRDGPNSWKRQRDPARQNKALDDGLAARLNAFHVLQDRPKIELAVNFLPFLVC